jgi:hypothetical protein
MAICADFDIELVFTLWAERGPDEVVSLEIQMAETKKRRPVQQTIVSIHMLK